MQEMVKGSFHAAAVAATAQVSITNKLAVAKDYVRNSFKGGSNEQSITLDPGSLKTPTALQVAQARGLKSKQEKGAYTSSNILCAYKKFRSLEKKAEAEKRKRFEVEVRKKYNVEITDATEFKQTVS